MDPLDGQLERAVKDAKLGRMESHQFDRDSATDSLLRWYQLMRVAPTTSDLQELFRRIETLDAIVEQLI